MGIPKQVKVGGHRIEIVLIDDLNLEDGDVGQFLPNSNRIEIQSGLPESQKEETFLHELIHVIKTMTGDKEDEEITIRFSQMLYQVIKDNPKMFNDKARDKKTR